MSNFVSLNTALSALQAARVRMDAAANNVANVGTAGYTRQKVDLVARQAFISPVGQIGTGVDVDSVTRARDAFLDSRVRQSVSTFTSLSARADMLDRTEQVLAEPEEGLTARLADLWATFEELGIAPNNTGARIAVIGSLNDVAARVRSVWEGWESIGADASGRLTSTVSEVNDLLAAVGDLNRQIGETQMHGMPNELLDQRDVVVDRLAELIGATATDGGDGSVRISLGGLGLVDGRTVRPLVLNPDNTITHVSGQTVTTGGEISGLQGFLTVDLPAYQAKLNTFAKEFADALNTQHAAGFSAAGTPGGPLFTYVAGSEARALTVAVTDPSELAVSDDGSAPFPTFNGENAQRLAELRTALVAAGGTDSLDGRARALAIELGASVAAAGRSADAQRGLATAAEMSRQGSHGVSLDEEMAYLIEAQHAYDAAARIMSAVDEAIDTLINRTGIVGR